ncbi:hypothetical protein BaRGS_00014015, partial [Batillaria attramentaria]
YDDENPVNTLYDKPVQTLEQRPVTAGNRYYKIENITTDRARSYRIESRSRPSRHLKSWYRPLTGNYHTQDAVLVLASAGASGGTPKNVIKGKGVGGVHSLCILCLCDVITGGKPRQDQAANGHAMTGGKREGEKSEHECGSECGSRHVSASATHRYERQHMQQAGSHTHPPTTTPSFHFNLRNDVILSVETSPKSLMRGADHSPDIRTLRRDARAVT